jgi:hypothetical protein
MRCAPYELTDRNLPPLLADLVLEEMSLCEVANSSDAYSGRHRSIRSTVRDLLTSELL